MFFGVDLGPVKHRLGINIDRVRETRTIDQRSRARSKYGIPFTSRWKVEIQNLSREISWQDLKDFCFNKTGVRPSRADINQDKRIGTLCCGTEKELRSVLLKLNGANLKGKSLKAVDISDHNRDENRHIKSKSRRQENIAHDERARDDSHRSVRHKSDRSTNTHRSSNVNDKKRTENNQTSNSRNVEEPKVIIHQPNGDRVITERIGNIDEYNTGDEGHISENEQAYFKRDRKSSRSGEDGRSQRSRRENGHDNTRMKRKNNKAYKLSLAHKTRWRIRVENLSSEVSWQDLKDLIRPYAEVKYADAHTPIQGIGNVHVSSEEGLHNVINKMNNSDIKGMIARFVDDSLKDEEPVEVVKRSRSPHRKRSSKNSGNESSKRSKSK